MKKYILICVLFISCFFMFIGCGDSSTKENEKSLVISAASSLTDPLNEIVLIINKNFKNHGDIKSIEDLRKIKLDKLSIGTPETVPAGKYGLEALNYYNIFDNLKDDIVYGKTVKDVLNYVLTYNDSHVLARTYKWNYLIKKVSLLADFFN